MMIKNQMQEENILEWMLENELKSRVVFVVRYFGNEKMGPERFLCYKQAAYQAVLNGKSNYHTGTIQQPNSPTTIKKRKVDLKHDEAAHSPPSSQSSDTHEKTAQGTPSRFKQNVHQQPSPERIRMEKLYNEQFGPSSTVPPQQPQAYSYRGRGGYRGGRGNPYNKPRVYQTSAPKPDRYKAGQNRTQYQFSAPWSAGY